MTLHARISAAIEQVRQHLETERRATLEAEQRHRQAGIDLCRRLRADALAESHALRAYTRLGLFLTAPPMVKPWEDRYIDVTRSLPPRLLLPDAGERNGRRAA